MMEMSWIHSSKVIALGVSLAVILSLAGTATALTIEEQAGTDSAQVGEEVTFEVTLDELYGGDQNLPETWTLRTESELNNPSITVIVRDSANEEVNRSEVQSSSVDMTLANSNNADSVEVTVTGTAPELDGFSYDEMETENVTALRLSQVVENGTNTLDEWPVHRYTESSQDARQAIEDAEAAVANSSSSDAQSRLSEAKTFYDNGNFQQAIDAANDAQNIAESEGQTQRMLLIGGAAVVVLLVIGGGIFYWRNQDDNTSKLQ